jgi:ribosomal protein S18 acetylase RimI-like enzyme
VDEPSWNLRPARLADRDFLYALNKATMGEYVDAVWGWDDQEQVSFFDNRFQPDRWQVIQIDGQDIGVLIVEEQDDQIRLAWIEILPRWQGHGIGTAVIRSLMDDAASAGKALTLEVLHVNERARALYERLGFRPFRQTETHAHLRWDG